MTHAHDSSCGCCKSVTSATQTLEELDFERGVWSAALNGEIERVRKYLLAKNDPNQVDSSGYTALHYASRSGHVEVCRLLLSHGALVNSVTRSGHVTSLHRAAYSGHCHVVRLLVDSGATLLLQDADGKTALHKAAERGHYDIVNLLLSADRGMLGVRDSHGRTALDCTPSQFNDVQTLLQQYTDSTAHT